MNKTNPAFSQFVLPSRPWSDAQAQHVLDEIERNWISAAAFCRRHDVPVQQIYVWRHRLRKLVELPEPTAFLPVCLEQVDKPKLEALPQPLELVHPSGIVMRVGAGVSTEQLADVLRALKGVTC